MKTASFLPQFCLYPRVPFLVICLKQPCRVFARQAVRIHSHGERVTYLRLVYSCLQMPKTTTKSKTGLEQERDILATAPEVSVFIHCLVMVNQLRSLERAFKDREITRGAFLDKSNAVLAQFNEAVATTERFDIILPVLDFGRFSPFFWRWFNWWDDFFKGLNSLQIAEIERMARERAPGVSGYRPSSHWIGYRHTPAFTLVPA